jgi:ABC-2 type transport system permease protein
MSAASGRDQAAARAATGRKRPESNRSAKLRPHLANIYRLVIKELRSIRSDPIMLALLWQICFRPEPAERSSAVRAPL